MKTDQKNTDTTKTYSNQYFKKVGQALARKLNEGCEQLSPKALLFMLIAFCALSGSYCLSLLIGAL